MNSLHSSSLLVRDLRSHVWQEAARKHNSACEANNLPAEILSTIFELVQGDQSFLTAIPGFWYPRPSWDAIGQVHSMRWLQVTAVCRRWRQVAISNPLLWNTIALRCPFGGPAEPEYELSWFHRAADALLDVHIWDYFSIHPRLLEAITSRSGQLRRLDIHRA